MLDKAITDIDEADLQQLVDDKEPEGLYLEYKEALPGNSDSDKKEFLADVSALGNTAGGHLVYGITEQRDENKKPTGLPDELAGVSCSNSGAEMLRLEQIIRTGIEPRIPSVTVKPIDLANSKCAFVIRVRRSWAGPHVVSYQGHWRFYARSQGGKYPLDVSQLRAAFHQGDLTSQQVIGFRLDRLAQITARQTPVPLVDGGSAVLHLIPLASFDPGVRYDMDDVDKYQLRLISGSTGSIRVNFDGIVAYNTDQSDRASSGFLQVFRSGRIEAVDTSLLRFKTTNGDGQIPGAAFEQHLIAAYNSYIQLLRNLGVEAPLMVCLSLLNVKGYIMTTNSSLMIARTIVPIDRDDLVVPEKVLEDWDVDGATVLRPLFDLVWNACGWDRSMNYNEEGKWAPRQ